MESASIICDSFVLLVFGAFGGAMAVGVVMLLIPGWYNHNILLCNFCCYCCCCCCCHTKLESNKLFPQILPDDDIEGNETIYSIDGLPEAAGPANLWGISHKMISGCCTVMMIKFLLLPLPQFSFQNAGSYRPSPEVPLQGSILCILVRKLLKCYLSDRFRVDITGPGVRRWCGMMMLLLFWKTNFLFKTLARD
jgi:hypothetical protein